MQDYNRGKTKDRALVTLQKLSTSQGKEDFRVKQIKQKITEDSGKEINHSSLVSSLKSLLEEGFVEKTGWGQYRLSDEGMKVANWLLSKSVNRTERRGYYHRGVFQLQFKIEKNHDLYLKYLKEINEYIGDFTLVDIDAKTRDDEELVTTVINGNTPENDCIEFMIGLFTPYHVDKKDTSYFDFEDEEARKFFVFSYLGRIYLDYIIPTYNKIISEDRDCLSLEDIKLIFIGLADFRNDIFYTNEFLNDVIDGNKEAAPFTDFIKNRWNFKLNRIEYLKEE